MEEISYCGYSCHLCAARSEDPDIRQKLVDGWRKYFGHQQYTAENVQCDGCRNDGKLADKQCEARPCAKEKGVKSCVLCDEFPCKKVGHLLATREGMLLYCLPKTLSLTEEEYTLCMKQFESMPTLIKILKEEGKVSW